MKKKGLSNTKKNIQILNNWVLNNFWMILFFEGLTMIICLLAILVIRSK